MNLLHSWELLGFTYCFPEYLFGTKRLPSNVELWGLIYVGLLILSWRYLSVESRLRPCIQELLHRKLGFRKRYVQWHAILHGILIWEMLIILIEFFWKGVAVERSLIDGSHRKTPTPLWVARLATLSPFACAAVFVVVSLHIGRLARLADAFSPHDLDNFICVDFVILCVTLPSLFSLLSLFALLRKFPALSEDLDPQLGYHDRKWLFHADLILAFAAELMAIEAFAHLVLQPLFRTNDRPKIRVLLWNHNGLAWLTMNGVYFCIVTGFVQNVSELLCLVCLKFTMDDKDKNVSHGWPHWLDGRISSHRETINTLSLVGLGFCIYNMHFVCELHPVKSFIRSPNRKFQGTRLIVVVAQLQGAILSPPYTLKDNDNIYRFWLTGNTCAILHVALLQYEVLLFAVINWLMWTDYYQRQYANVLRLQTITRSGLLETTPASERHWLRLLVSPKGCLLLGCWLLLVTFAVASWLLL